MMNKSRDIAKPPTKIFIFLSMLQHRKKRICMCHDILSCIYSKSIIYYLKMSDLIISFVFKCIFFPFQVDTWLFPRMHTIGWNLSA